MRAPTPAQPCVRPMFFHLLYFDLLIKRVGLMTAKNRSLGPKLVYHPEMALGLSYSTLFSVLEAQTIAYSMHSSETEMYVFAQNAS